MRLLIFLGLIVCLTGCSNSVQKVWDTDEMRCKGMKMTQDSIFYPKENRYFIFTRVDKDIYYKFQDKKLKIILQETK